MTASPIELPPPSAHIHFVGIGGIGMSGLARILAHRGNRITGSDSTDSDLIRDLQADGIAVAIGHDDVEHAKSADLIVMTSAVGAANPEIAAARERGIPVIKRAELLGMLARESKSVAVAGSHGKSTTSAMITSVLRRLGASPTYVVGAILQETGRNAEPGSGDLIVIEADEYDRSFHTLYPDFAVVTNIDYDHPDIYPTPESYKNAFEQFARQVSPDGALIVNSDDEGSRRLFLESAGEQPPARLVTFGRSNDADWRIASGPDGDFLFGPDGTLVRIRLQVPGHHNLANAAAVVAVLTEAGFKPEDVAASLADYGGIGRRFEFKGRANGVEVIDDYAHHPTEVAATLRAARSRFPDRRIWAVFQPHTYSRTHALRDDFAVALSLADQRMVLDVYAAREPDDGLVIDSDLRLMAGVDGERATSPADAASALMPMLQPGDVVLSMGAGTITDLADHLLPLLKDHAASQERANEQR